jgi:hypothetical protein
VQDLSVGVNLYSGGIRFQDGSAALSGDLINVQSAIGAGVVAHGSFAFALVL